MNQMPTPNRPRRFSPWLPLVFAVCVVAGILVGIVLSAGSENPFSNNEETASGKVSQILRLIEKEYVDTLDSQRLSELTIRSILDELDPHSYYISAEELASFTEPLEGNFDGIGLEFRMLRDSVTVIHPVIGGPSDQVGIIAGDRVIAVNDTNITGGDLRNEAVIARMKGKSGTKVKLTVKRRGEDEPIDFIVTRAKVPLYSVEASFLAEEGTGYIKITRFAKTTYEEFVAATTALKAQGMTRLIMDLRNNGGGILKAATDIADEFLQAGQMIVYTEGKARQRESIEATAKGNLENMPLVILINENSASASEIVAGAIQDHDRGEIIGRRSFGKGLVQEQRPLGDGSAIRLTVARYYTPTGRCIQKPYGDGIDYYAEYEKRLERGELMHLDSIQLPDSLRFITPGGKVVYGGGGITPNHFIPLDTAGITIYFQDLSYSGAFNNYTFDYADKNREALNAFGSFEEYRDNFRVSDDMVAELTSYGRELGVPKDTSDNAETDLLIRRRIKAMVARNIWRDEGYYPLIMPHDKAYQEALEILP